MNPEQAHQLIEKLKEPLLHEGEQVYGGCLGGTEPMYKPLRIGDIIFMMSDPLRIGDIIFMMSDPFGTDCSSFSGTYLDELFFLWQPFGNKSLQDILADEVEVKIIKDRPLHKGGGYPKKQLSDR